MITGICYSQIYLPAIVFLFFYYRKEGKLPFPIALFGYPLGIFLGNDKITPAPPAPPTPPPNPCKPCHGNIKEHALHELGQMPVAVSFKLTFVFPGGFNYTQTQQLTVPANQLQEAYSMINKLVNDANATGKVQVTLSDVTAKPIPANPAIVREAENWVSNLHKISF